MLCFHCLKIQAKPLSSALLAKAVLTSLIKVRFFVFQVFLSCTTSFWPRPLCSLSFRPISRRTWTWLVDQVSTSQVRISKWPGLGIELGHFYFSLSVSFVCFLGALHVLVWVALPFSPSQKKATPRILPLLFLFSWSSFGLLNGIKPWLWGIYFLPRATVAEKSIKEEEMGSIHLFLLWSFFVPAAAPGSSVLRKGDLCGKSGIWRAFPPLHVAPSTPLCTCKWLGLSFSACSFLLCVHHTGSSGSWGCAWVDSPFSQESQGCLCCLDSPWLPVPLCRSRPLLVLACLTFWLRLFLLSFVETEVFVYPPRLLLSPSKRNISLLGTCIIHIFQTRIFPSQGQHSLCSVTTMAKLLSVFLLIFLCCLLSFLFFVLFPFPFLSFFPCPAFFSFSPPPSLSINIYLSFSFIFFFISSIIYLSASDVFIYNSSLSLCLTITYLSLSSAVCLAVPVIYVFLSVNICPCHCVSVYCLSLSLSFICLISIYILFIFSCPSPCLTPSPCAYHSHSIFISLTPVISYFMVSFCPFISFQGLSIFFPSCFSVSHSLI